MAETQTLADRIKAEDDALKLLNEDVKGMLADDIPLDLGIFSNDIPSQNTAVNEANVAGSNLVMADTPGTFEGPKWKERLDATLENYDTIASHLPYPTANPILMKQRQTLQKRADGYSYLQSKAPRPIRWEDNFTNADLVRAWKAQKNPGTSTTVR